MKSNASGQTLLFYAEARKTFYCATCNREIPIRFQFTHPSSATHRRTARAAHTPVKRYRRPRVHRAVTRSTEDDALENYYRQCAIEDGTFETIAKEYGL